MTAAATDILVAEDILVGLKLLILASTCVGFLGVGRGHSLTPFSWPPKMFCWACTITLAWSCTALTTCGWQCPVEVTPMPALKVVMQQSVMPR